MSPARMPDGLPDRFDGPSAWHGEDLADTPELWLHHLSQADIAELEAAARGYLATGRDIGEIDAGSFPAAPTGAGARRSAPDASPRDRLSRPARPAGSRLSQEVAAAIFCGVGAHLGRARSQNAAGHILGHVRDQGADANDPNTRIYQTSARQTFHTDSADAVGLLCLREAMEGGDSLLVSVETIFNRMRAARPDLLALLFDPIATDRRGEVPEGMKPFMEIPPLSWHAGHLTVFYQRQYIDSAQRFPDAMRLTPGSRRGARYVRRSRE
jgi:hypothetical protein